MQVFRRCRAAELDYSAWFLVGCSLTLHHIGSNGSIPHWRSLGVVVPQLRPQSSRGQSVQNPQTTRPSRHRHLAEQIFMRPSMRAPIAVPQKPKWPFSTRKHRNIPHPIPPLSVPSFPGGLISLAGFRCGHRGMTFREWNAHIPKNF